MTPADPPAHRPLTGGAVMGVVSRMVVAATGAATTILIARLLGPDGSGGFFAAQTLVLLVTVLAALGVEHGIAYYVSAGAWAAASALRAALRLVAVSGVVGALVVTAARLVVPSAFSGLGVWETLAAAAGVPFWLALTNSSFSALAVDRYEAYVLPPALQSALALALAGAGAIAFGLGGAIVGVTLATAIVGAAISRWALRRLRRAAPDPPGMLRRAVAFGVKGYAANALQLLNYRGDIFILSAVSGAAADGQYSVAVTSVLWLLPNALAEVVFPRIARLSADGSAAAQREMVEVKGLRHVTLSVAAVSAVLALAIVTLLVPVYGDLFRPAVAPALILLVGSALIGIANVLASSVAGRGRPELNLYTVLVSTPITLALYALLIPPLDATGAALASTVSYGVNFVMTARFYRRLTGRSALWGMLPGADELGDLRRLAPAGRAWLRGLRDRGRP